MLNIELWAEQQAQNFINGKLKQIINKLDLWSVLADLHTRWFAATQDGLTTMEFNDWVKYIKKEWAYKHNPIYQLHVDAGNNGMSIDDVVARDIYQDILNNKELPEHMIKQILDRRKTEEKQLKDRQLFEKFYSNPNSQGIME